MQIHKLLPVIYPVLGKHISSIDRHFMRMTEKVHIGMQLLIRERTFTMESLQQSLLLHFVQVRNKYTEMLLSMARDCVHTISPGTQDEQQIHRDVATKASRLRSHGVTRAKTQSTNNRSNKRCQRMKLYTQTTLLLNNTELRIFPRKVNGTGAPIVCKMYRNVPS